LAHDSSSGVNDFGLKIATVNGTGSASANGLLLQALFRMGIPVSGKNVFPSNIQGLPTWYEIRVNGDGYTARSPDFQLVVAMNPESYARDIEEVVSGGWILYDSSCKLSEEFKRDDVSFLGVPLADMCVGSFQGSRTRILMKNITYVGALVALLDIDMDVVKGMLQEKFAAKQHLMDANFIAIELGYDYVKQHFDCPLPIRLETMDATKDSVLVTGNAAAALGCVYAGATVGAWYPITPATSVMDGFTEYCHRLRVDPETGKKNFCILQAEDELAAAGMVIGASWMGARAFTPTSGPGISLMSEFIGLAYYAEIPSVFFDIQRTGPSTGMPTRTQQGDLMLCAYLSHGDTKHIVLFPADPKECFEFAVAAFDLAERFQTPTFVVSDLDIGMNDWMIPKLEWDDSFVPDRGKVLSAEELEEVDRFYRYLDVDGDHIAARTLPGVHPKGAYFARGSGHDKYGRYTEDSDAYVDVVDRLLAKVESAADAVPAPELHVVDGGSRLGLVSLGGCHWAVIEARDHLIREGVQVDYMRVRGFPFNDAVEQFLDEHDVVVVIEQNRDEQLRKLLLLETSCAKEKLVSVTDYGGQPLSKGHVLEGVAPYLEVATVEAS
jgi:2-oxoglutarate ferredoxin oxidoreductase subunit alpha